MARVLITGCSTGIGRATAVELARRGHEVIATARRAETLDDLDVARRLRLDVDDDDSVAAATAEAGELDALVSNAGLGAVSPLECHPVAEAKRLFETNVFGTLRMIQAVVPAMRDRGRGTIVTVSSVAGRVPLPLEGVYAASKHALEALSEALHFEVGHFGLRVRIVEPGRIDTPFHDLLRCGVDVPPYDELDRQFRDGTARLLTGGGSPGPEVVARTIADALESDEARLRWPVGPDAELVLPVRASMDDAGFEATMRATLGIEW